MPRIDIGCASGHVAEVFVPLSAYVEGEGYPTPPCEACGEPTAQVFLPHHGHVIDDTLTGGARWMHNLGDDPVWVETKTQLKQEMDKRGLVFANTQTYNRDDKSPYATRTRLRPGQRDGFIHRGDQ